MPLPPNFRERLAETTDANLYDILAHPEDYIPEALDATREEIQRRNLSADKIAQLRSDSEAQKSNEDKLAEQGLPWYVKALLFCGLFPFFYLFAVYNESKGFKKRARQCWSWAGYGLIFWFVAGVLLELF
jgi:hypothetical protein